MGTGEHFWRVRGQDGLHSSYWGQDGCVGDMMLMVTEH